MLTDHEALPTRVSDFLGREHELREADQLLRSTRLLTVTGPGGAGKTRLALELARRAREERCSDYEDGVFACFLASLRDPALVLATMAQTLDVLEQAGMSAFASLTQELQGKRMLLLLDNIEHLLAAAPKLTQLLAACPHLTLLVTSREPLRIPGEQHYELPPLAEAEGVELFCERARLEPTETISEVCRRLDGLPLAIELAAVRTRLLTPDQLLDRLSSRLDLLKGPRDADPRQQTLRATIEWSHDLLSPHDQQLFASLSVFAGGCTLEAAEHICNADLDTLASLLDKNLLRQTDERYWMLETIRHYAAEELRESGVSGELQTRHANHFTSMAETAEGHLIGAEAAHWTERLAADHDNLRVALTNLLENDACEQALELAVALRRFWLQHGDFREGRNWLERVAAAGGESASPSLYSRAIGGAGTLAFVQGDVVAARSFLERSLQLAREAGDRESEMISLGDLANVASTEGDHVSAIAMYERVRDIAMRHGDDWILILTAMNLGFLQRICGDLAKSEDSLLDAVDRARELGNEYFLAVGLSELAAVRLVQGRAIEAKPALEEALKHATVIEDRATTASVHGLMAVADVQVGEPLSAARLAGASSTMTRAIGADEHPIDKELIESHLVKARDAAGGAAFDEAWRVGTEMTAEEAIAYALRTDE